jgi:hypothetical protein
MKTNRNRYRVILFVGIIVAMLSSLGLTDADTTAKMQPLGAGDVNHGAGTDGAPKYTARVEFCTS